MTLADKSDLKEYFNWIRQRLPLFVSLGIAFLGFMLTCQWHYPGQPNGDMIWQFQQSHDGPLSDWHPPLLAYLCRWLDAINPTLDRSKENLFLVTTALFWGGLWMSLWPSIRSIQSKFRWMALLAFLVGFYPPVSIFFPQLVKDSVLVSVLLAAFGFLRFADSYRSSKYLAIGLVFVFIANMLRLNAFCAVIAFLAYAAWIIVERLSISRFGLLKTTSKVYKIILCTSGLLALLNFSCFFTQQFLTQEKRFPEQQYLLFDLVGVSVRSNQNLLPPVVIQSSYTAPVTMDYLKQLYLPNSCFTLYWGGWPNHPAPKSLTRLAFLSTQPQITELWQSWRSAIWKYPGLWIAHRLEVFRHLLQIPPQPQYPWNAHEDVFQQKLGLTQTFLKVLFKPWLYLALLLSLISGVLILNHKYQKAYWCNAEWSLALSSLGFFLSYFFAVDAELRYLYWSIVATCVLFVLTLLRVLPPTQKRVFLHTSVGYRDSE